MRTFAFAVIAFLISSSAFAVPEFKQIFSCEDNDNQYFLLESTNWRGMGFVLVSEKNLIPRQEFSGAAFERKNGKLEVISADESVRISINDTPDGSWDGVAPYKGSVVINNTGDVNRSINTSGEPRELTCLEPWF